MITWIEEGEIEDGSEAESCPTAIEFDRYNIRIQEYVYWLVRVKKLSKKEAVAQAKKAYES